MHYTYPYYSPLGKMLLAANSTAIIGIWFEGAKYYANCLSKQNRQKETPIIKKLKRWLDIYFQAKNPTFEPPICMIGTPFQIQVWKILRKIPYGTTMTYSEIAKKMASQRGLPHMSAQAVGAAIAKNSINLLIPCHRVIGSNNSLVGYAGGIDKKTYFLKLEGAYKKQFFVPKHQYNHLKKRKSKRITNLKD